MGGSGDTGAVGSASKFATLQNLIKPFIGAGILALPNAFAEGGVLASAILMVILALGVNYCIRCLLISVDYVHAREHDLDYDVQTGLFSPTSEPSRVSPSEGDADGPPALNGALTQSPSIDPTPSPIAPEFVGPNAVRLDNFHPSTGATGVPSALSSRPGHHSTLQITPHTDASSPIDPALVTPIFTFREIGAYAYGRSGKFAVDFNLVASQIGFCIAYMSFISENMTIVVPSLSRVQWIFILFAFWICLVQIRRIQSIAFTSTFGNIIYLVSLSIIFYDGFAHHCCVSAKDTAWIRVGGLAMVFGTGCFALEGIGLVLPVKRAMQDQSSFGFVLNAAVAIVTMCYVIFGVLGYLFYGDAVSSVITNNLSKGALSDAVRISLSISLLFTYAIQLFPVSEILDELWDAHVFRVKRGVALDEGVHHNEQYAQLEEESTSSPPLQQGLHNSPRTNINGSVSLPNSRSYDSFPPMAASPNEADVADSSVTNWRREAALIGTRIALVAFTAGVSLLFKNFGDIVSLVGSFSNSAIAFILPMLFYCRLVLVPELQKQRAHAAASNFDLTRWAQYQAFLLPGIIIVGGVCASAVGVTTTIRSIVKGDSD